MALRGSRDGPRWADGGVLLVLETPLFGKFANEDRILVFSAPTAYHALIRACVIGGALGTLYGFLASSGIVEAPLYPTWWVFTGAAVALAGVFAAYSLVMIRFDVKGGQYRRREGGGAFGVTTVGTLTDLDAVVLIAEPNSRMTPSIVDPPISAWVFMISHSSGVSRPGFSRIESGIPTLPMSCSGLVA